MDEQIIEPTSGEGEPEPMQGFVQELKADNVEFTQGFAGMVSAKQDVTMMNSGALGLAAGRDMEINDGGGFGVAVGHDLTLTDGGAFSLTVGGNAELTDGGALMVMAGSVTARNSRLGIVLGPATLEEGSQVLMDGKQAAFFGAAFGAVLGLLLWLLRKK